MNEDEILKKYKLSDEEHERYYEIIKRTFLSNKIPVTNPIAVIIGGQTGAGKSGIIGYSTKMFSDNNVVIVNSDEFKPFHPKSEEIATLYPSLYTKITDQESNTWTSKFFEETRRMHYNLIFEGTMKNNRVADESITELQNLGYTVVVRGLSVCDLESRISILERYEAQVNTKGWGRLVVPEHHNQTYKGMPNTIDYIEETGKYDILEIYARGDKLAEPVRIFGKHNIESKAKIENAIEGKEEVSKYTRTFGYNSGKDAVLGGREEEYDRVIPTMKNRLKKVLESMNARNASNEEIQMVMDLMNEFEDVVKKKRDNKLEEQTILSSNDTGENPDPGAR